MLSGIIVTHAGLAEALRAAAARIAGDTSAIGVVSNEGLGAEPLLAEIRAALARTGVAGTVVFTDMGGGSCTTAVQLVLREFPRVRLVTGVNLPMLVDFVLRRAELDLDAMVTRLVQRGQISIQELK
jgi:mannose/fructose-specific phosphotransferase system component IIA